MTTEPTRARHRAGPGRASAVAVPVGLAAALAAALVVGVTAFGPTLAGPGGGAVERAAAPTATTERPTTERPATETPATDPSATEPSATEPPATELPGSERPIGSVPAGRGEDAVPGPAVAPAAAGGTEQVAPVGLSIPAIDLVDVAVDPLGLRDDGSIDVPDDADRTGWLTASAAPGTRGPAVLAGHVDSADGAAVFTRLGELEPGDEVVVGLADGTDVTYRVSSKERYPKTGFPTDRVYGPAPAPVLRLVTCGGAFDREAGSYVDNVVVYATLVV